MKTFKSNEKITVLGVTFIGVEEIIQCALEKKAKHGIYVGCDSERYPCFDSSDYASENRSYWNFVFATSIFELDRKLSVLKDMKPLDSNYNKLTEDLHPMAYWMGDPYYPVFLTDAVEKPLDEPKKEENNGKNWQEVTSKAVGMLDMVIAFDTTGSMAAYIDAVRQEVAEMVPRLLHENKELRIGIVAFGDYCDMKNAQEFGDAYQCLMPTDNENEIIRFIRNSKDTSGGDGDEFYELVIRKIVDETPWRENATRTILLISDANPHPLGYTYGTYVTNNQIDWRKEAEKAASKKIKIDTVTISNNKWYKELSRMTNGVSVPFRSGQKTAHLVEIAAMARGSMDSRHRFDKLAESCMDKEMSGIFSSYAHERNKLD